MLQTVKVPTTDLTKGMFVSGLDRDWLGTPFLTQGFLLKTETDVERVRDYCDFVWIDIQKCVYVSANLQRMAQGERQRVSMTEIFKGRELKAYADQAEWKEEHPRATKALATLLTDITDIFDKAAAVSYTHLRAHET